MWQSSSLPKWVLGSSSVTKSSTFQTRSASPAAIAGDVWTPSAFFVSVPCARQKLWAMKWQGHGVPVVLDLTLEL